ncbi:MAG: hypothetical protein WBM17_09955 [Anaerolineales bacterium]
MNTLTRIITVARMEFLFCLRRGGPIIGMVIAGLILTIATMFFGSNNAAGLSSAAATQAGAQALAQSWPAFEWLVLGLFPIVAVTAIPLDRQFGVFELLRSMPLTGGVYLLGKVIGTLAAVLGTGLLVFILHIILHVIMIGTPQADLYLKLTLLSGLPNVVWATSIGVLAGTAFKSRLTAILAGVPTAIAGIFLWNAPSWFAKGTDPSLSGGSSRLAYSPVSSFILGHFDALKYLVSGTPNGGSRALQSIVISFFVLICAVIAARFWLLWKEDY